MREEDAIKIIVSWLRDGQPGDLRHFGYDLHLDNFIRIHIRRQPRESREEPFAEDRQLRELYPVFANAAWELCRRGILRPGVKEWGGQSTGEGEGFSLTPFGRNWISEGGSDVFYPLSPNVLLKCWPNSRTSWERDFMDVDRKPLSAITPEHISPVV